MSLKQTKINRLIALYVFAADYYSSERGYKMLCRAARRLIKRWDRPFFDSVFGPTIMWDKTRETENYKILEAKYGSKI